MREVVPLVIVALVPVCSARADEPTDAGPPPASVDSLEALRSGGLRQLTSHPAVDIEPKWSPDGRALSFASDRDGTWNVWTVARDGGEAVRLTADLELVHSTWWSPDGSRLAVATAVAQENGYAGHIQILDVATGNMTRLTSGPVDGAPCWSPDGERIAFVSNRSGNWDLWSVPVAGGEETQLTTFEGFDHSPRWSPDGSRIAYHSASSGNGDIWIVSLSDSTAARVTVSEAFDHFPTWSPDGRWLAFHSDRDGSFDIWAIPAAGGPAIQLTSGPANDQRPAWSPDGTAIAFNSDRGGSVDIWLLSAADGGTR